MNQNIVAAVAESNLENEFLTACENPQELDCGFVEQRRESGFANFGFSPDRAAEMREKELTRIAAELENEPLDYEDEDDEDFDEWTDDDDEDLDDDEDDLTDPWADEDMPDDRFNDGYGPDFDEDDE